MKHIVASGSCIDEEAGFTLVELLVSLALLAMMSAYAVSAIRTFSAMDRVSKSFERQAEEEAARRNLRQLIGDARLVFRTDENGLPSAIFLGKPETLMLVSVLNDRLERGGLYVLEFGLNAESQTFELRRRVYRPTGEGNVRKISILDGVESVRWRYCAMPCNEDDSKLWLDQWETIDRLPSRVALEIVLSDKSRNWPVLRIPLVSAQ